MAVPTPPSNQGFTANEIYLKFKDGEKKYGQLVSLNDRLLSGWHHLRVTTSQTALKTCYKRPRPDSINICGSHFYPDASKALFLISYYNDVKSYQIGELLKLRADPNSRLDESADTSLHRLTRSGSSVDCIQLLVEWGADLNARNILGRTPLMEACDVIETTNRIQLVRYLLSLKNLDLNTCDYYGDSAGTLALKRSNIWILRDLLVIGIVVNTPSTSFGMNNSVGENIVPEILSVVDVSVRLRSGLPSNSGISSYFRSGSGPGVGGVSSGMGGSSSPENHNVRNNNQNRDHNTANNTINNSIRNKDNANADYIRFSDNFHRNDSKMHSNNNITQNAASKLASKHFGVDGTPYDSHSLLFLNSLWKRKINICHMMIIRKEKEENREMKSNLHRLKRVEKLQKIDAMMDNDNYTTNPGKKDSKRLKNMKNVRGKDEVINSLSEATVTDADLSEEQKNSPTNSAKVESYRLIEVNPLSQEKRRKDKKASKISTKKSKEITTTAEFSLFSRLKLAKSIDKEFSKTTSKRIKNSNTDLQDKVEKEQKEGKDVRESSEKGNIIDGKVGKEVEKGPDKVIERAIDKDIEKAEKKEKKNKDKKKEKEDKKEKKWKIITNNPPPKSSLWQSATAPKNKTVRFGIDENFKNLSIDGQYENRKGVKL